MRDLIEDFTVTGIEKTPPEVGQIMVYTGENIPEGWLLCDGRMLRRHSYPELYKVPGVKYGDGDGSHTAFNLPNIAFPTPGNRYIILVDAQNT